MDVTVTTATGGAPWHLTDLLGRDMGTIVQTGTDFMIQPAGHAIQTFAALSGKRYASVDDALAAIEQHTRGVCRRKI